MCLYKKKLFIVTYKAKAPNHFFLSNFFMTVSKVMVVIYNLNRLCMSILKRNINNPRSEEIKEDGWLWRGGVILQFGSDFNLNLRDS